MFLIAALAWGNESTTLERKAHDHTIYTLRGTTEQLSHFEAEIGSEWRGGSLLSKDGSEYRYWAYSERTAPQAREFMFGSMTSGLKLEIEAYEEVRFFPAERAELDSIALKCGFPADPFFITPTRELLMGPAPKATLQNVECGLAAIKASNTLRTLPMGLVGSETSAKEQK